MAIILIAYSQGLKLWVAPGRLVANAVAIIHSNCALCTIWLCHCCVLYPGYVSPRCSLVPKQGCMVWEHYFSAISGLEMASEAILGHLIFLGWGGGGGGMPPDSPSWCVLCKHSSTATGLVAPHSSFRPC